MTGFGNLLRNFRQKCHDPNSGKVLSQQRLGDLLGEELGTGFSGAAISDWEHGKSKIHADDRLVLMSLIKVLNKNGGIGNSSEADTLLEAGNYRALNLSEKQRVFPDEPTDQPNDPPAADTGEQRSFINLLLGNIFFKSPEEFSNLLNETKEGPSPAWPRVVASILRKLSKQWSVLDTLKIMIWLWIWLLTYGLIAPSLKWPFETQEQAKLNLVLYTAGSLIIPLLIGVLTDTKSNAFWIKQNVANSLTTRLYVYQGAFIGFHLGYFIIFAVGLIRYSLHLRSANWLDLAAMLVPLIIGYAGGQLTPHNLWRAYGRLHLKDGGIFFIFVVLGPLWGLYFFKSYALLTSRTFGAAIILAAATLLIGLMALQYRRKGNTVIPLLWWVIFYGLIVVCQVISFFIK